MAQARDEIPTHGPRAPVHESDEDKPGVILNYDKDGNIVDIEILEASRRVEDPPKVEYLTAGASG